MHVREVEEAHIDPRRLRRVGTAEAVVGIQIRVAGFLFLGRRWSELERGGGNNYWSWSIERDPAGVPYRCIYSCRGDSQRERIPDREAGALRRVRDVCERNGLHFYHQTDPRGCSLYVDREPLPDNNYTRGISCA